MGVLCLPSKWQDFCLLLLSWLACSSLPPQSHSTQQLFLEAGTTTEMLEGLDFFSVVAVANVMFQMDYNLVRFFFVSVFSSCCCHFSSRTKETQPHHCRGRLECPRCCCCCCCCAVVRFLEINVSFPTRAPNLVIAEH